MMPSMKFWSISVSWRRLMMRDKECSFCSMVRMQKTNFAEMHCMFKSFIKMSWQVAHYTPTSAGILRSVNHLFSRIISCTCITESLSTCCSRSNHGSSSVGVWPSLSLLNHSNEWAQLKHSPPKEFVIFNKFMYHFSPILTQNLMQNTVPSLPTFWVQPEMWRDIITSACSTKVEGALPNSFGPSFLPCR